MTSALCCEICLEEFGCLVEREPLLLNCAHTFCRSCLTTIAERCETRYIPCPKCRKRTDKNIESLQRNFMLIPTNNVPPHDDSNATLFLGEVSSINAFGTLLVYGDESQKALALDNLKMMFEKFINSSVVLNALIPSLIAALKKKDNEKASNCVLQFVAWWLDSFPLDSSVLRSERFLAAIASHQLFIASKSTPSPYYLLLKFVRISEENALAVAKSVVIAQLEVSLQFETGSTQYLALCILAEIAEKSDQTRTQLIQGEHFIETIVYCINSRSFLEETTHLVIAMSESPAIAEQIFEHEGLSCLISLLPLRHNPSNLPILRAMAKLLSVQQSWSSHFLDAPVIMYFASTIRDSSNNDCRKQCAIMLEMLVKEETGDELFDRFEILSLCAYVIQHYVTNQNDDNSLLLLLMLQILSTLTKRSRFQMEVTGHVEMMIKFLNDTFPLAVHELVLGIFINISSQICSLSHSFRQIQGLESIAHLLTLPTTSTYCTELVLSFLWTLLSTESSFGGYISDSLITMNTLHQLAQQDGFQTEHVKYLVSSLMKHLNAAPVVTDPECFDFWRVLANPEQDEEVQLSAEQTQNSSTSPKTKRLFSHSTVDVHGDSKRVKV